MPDVGALIVREAVVEPEYTAPSTRSVQAPTPIFTCQRRARAPVTVAAKPALEPVATVALAGWAVKLGGTTTVRVAALEVFVGLLAAAAPVTTTRY